MIMKFLSMLLVSLVAIAALSIIANSEEAVELQEPRLIRKENNASSLSATPPRCDSLGTYKVKFQDLIDLSPFYLYHANNASFNCTQLAYVNPVVGKKDYTGHIVIVKLGTTSSIQVEFIKNRIIRAIWCDTGLTGDYPIVYANFGSIIRKRSVFCAVKCTDDGIDYEAVFCAGRTPDDEAEAQEFIDNVLPGVPGIVNVQAGCPQPQYCNFFNH